MKIGLHDSELEYLKRKTFPNYALMKISAYHKLLGNAVEWWLPIGQYDVVYSSKIFDFTPENPYLPPDTIKGGTGYDIFSFLPDEIEKKHGVKPYRVFIYLLVTSDIDNAVQRVERLKKFRGITIYAQAERNERMGIIPNKMQLEFAQRYIYSGKYRTETWQEYYEKRSG